MAFEKGVGRESAHKAILECADKSRSPNSESFFSLISKSSELKVSESELLKIKSAFEYHLGDAPSQARAVLILAKARISDLPEAKNLNLDEISN
jgi:adenylosuccinate lyase